MNAKFYYQDGNAPKPNKPNHLGVTAIIVNENNEILFEKRSDSNRWSLIGGGLKLDESLENCLKREVFEETGIKIDNVKLIKMYDDPSRIVAYPDGNVVRIITFAYEICVKNSSNLKISDESFALQFVAKKDIKALDIVETHKYIMEEYLENSNSKYTTV